MDHNPYAPPVAAVADPVSYLIPDSANPEPPFFAVSTFKLVVLSTCSLSLYEIYWFYKNWQLVRARERPNILPFWRAIFAYFYCYALFKSIRECATSLGVSSIHAGALATSWIVTTLLWKLPDPYWLASFLAIIFLIPVQVAVNRINVCVAPDHDENSTFSKWNWLTVIIGGTLLILSIMGTLTPT